MNNTLKQKVAKGFTLLELLIVIAIIAILSVILIIVINPAETLKKSRDVQRMSDLNTMKTALGLYATATTSPDFDASIANHCLTNAASNALISYSVNAADALCATNLTPGADSSGSADFSATDFCRYASGSALVDGTGWIPVDLASLVGG
jgi:prepilin-type N-terminal cleavage/methylation domain-containing protein